jgi:hypothetical protein
MLMTIRSVAAVVTVAGTSSLLFLRAQTATGKPKEAVLTDREKAKQDE